MALEKCFSVPKQRNMLLKPKHGIKTVKYAVKSIKKKELPGSVHTFKKY